MRKRLKLKSEKSLDNRPDIPVASTKIDKKRFSRQMTLVEYFMVQNFYWCWWRKNSGEGFAEDFVI